MTSPTHTYDSSQAVNDHTSTSGKTLKLSFCVPVYNLELYLDECLHSLTEQTYHNIEIICVDDGSTDHSAEKLRDWAKRDKRVRIITQQNAGEGAARNTAITHATGDYLAFVDGDDYIDEHTAAITLEAARTSDADIVVYGGRAFPEMHWITDTFGPRDAILADDGAHILLTEQGCIPSACNKIYKRSLITRNNLHFNEQLRLGADLNFQFKVFPHATRVTLISKRLYHYRYNRAGSAINQNYTQLSDQLMQHLELFDLTATEWETEGILAGRAPAFLGAISLIFGDFNMLEPAAQFEYARAFAPVFARHFTRSDLQPQMGVEAFLRYRLLLDLAACDGSTSSIAKLARTWQKKMQVVKLYRALRYGRVDQTSNANGSAVASAASAASTANDASEPHNNPEVTIIVPAYNAETTLERALTSALAQQDVRVRIVVIDDASTDNTLFIATSFADVFENVQVIHHETNLGRLEARRHGIKATQTEWCMFLDADDELLGDCAARLFAGQQSPQDHFDIVQCSFDIRTINYISPDELRFTQQFCAAPACTAHGDGVTGLVFGARRTTWSLCGKLMRTAQVHAALDFIPPATLNQAEDCCIFFIVSCLAKSYRGLGSYSGYIYHIDQGSSDARWASMNLEQFRFTCNFVKAMDTIKHFLTETGRINNPTLRHAYLTTRHEHALTVADKLLDKVKPNLRAEAFDMFASAWPLSEALGMVAQSGWDAPAKTWDDIHGAHLLHNDAREVHTVGIYHATMGTGGAERIGAWLARLWHTSGYQVVFFADCTREECAWNVPADIQWVQVSASCDLPAASYQARAAAFQQAIKQFDVDAFIYQQWWNPLLAWDMMTIKACGVPVCVFTHGSFDSLFYMGRIREYELTKIFRYADALVVLSEADVRFWQRFNPRVFQTNNPVFHSFADAATGVPLPTEKTEAETPSPADSIPRASGAITTPHAPTNQPVLAQTQHPTPSIATNPATNILWVGRLSEVQKQPSEALKIMARVVACEPAATLTLVGATDSPADMTALRTLVRELGLERHVIFAGNQSDVAPFYEKACAYLLTSRFESWCLSLAEAMDAGLPTVMYRLDHLTLVHDNPGIISVEQGEHATAAEALVRLLHDEQLRVQMGSAAKTHLAQVERFDHQALWGEVFAALGQGSCVRTGFEAADDEWDLLLTALQAGLDEAANQPFFPFVMRKGRAVARRIKRRLQGEISSKFSQ